MPPKDCPCCDSPFESTCDVSSRHSEHFYECGSVLTQYQPSGEIDEEMVGHIENISDVGGACEGYVGGPSSECLKRLRANISAMIDRVEAMSFEELCKITKTTYRIDPDGPPKKGLIERLKFQEYYKLLKERYFLEDVKKIGDELRCLGFIDSSGGGG